MAYDTKLMVKVASLYYKEDLKQESIARRLKIIYKNLLMDHQAINN